MSKVEQGDLEIDAMAGGQLDRVAQGRSGEAVGVRPDDRVGINRRIVDRGEGVGGLTIVSEPR
jgi:hypothetical protein